MTPGIRLVLPRPAASQTGLPRFVVLSIVGHVLLSALLIIGPFWRDGPSIAEEGWVVDLVRAAPAPPPERGTVRSTPQRTPPPKEQPAATVETPPPRPREQAPVTPRPEPDPPARPAADPRPVRPQPDTTPETTAEPPPGAPGDAEGAVTAAGDDVGSVEALDVAGFRYSWYRDAVTAALYSSWRKPVLAGNADVRVVRITFEIGRDGSLRQLRVATPSGVPSLDRSALRAVGDAAPFPPLPAGWGGSALPASFVFRLYPD